MNEELKKYFASKKGTGIIATSDKEGKVNAAIYSRPHITGDNEVAFIMPQRLTYKNLQENPYAHYLFKEVEHYNGKRLYLKMVREENDQELLNSIKRRHYSEEQEEKNETFEHDLFCY